MRHAVGSLAIVALFSFAGSLLAQSPEEDARRQRFFETLREGAAARGEGIGIVPVPRFAAPGPEGATAGGDGVGIVRVEEREFAPQGTIQFEAAIIHLKSAEDFSPEEQEVTGDTVDQLLQNWKANGKVERMSTFSLSSLERQQASVQTGEQVPVVTGRTTFGSGGRGGAFQNSVSYQDVGTVLRVTGRIDGTNVVVECQVEESRLEPGASIPTAPSDAADPGEQGPASDRVVNVPILGRTSVQTTVTIPDGGKVILSGLWTKEATTTDARERTEWNATIITLKATIVP
jgi:hypothetical protein